MRSAPSCRAISTTSRSAIFSLRTRRAASEVAATMNVLGISGSARDAAAAISVDGAIVAAASEESFARVPAIGYRHTGGYPLAAIAACLARAGVTVDSLDRVMVVADGP